MKNELTMSMETNNKRKWPLLHHHSVEKLESSMTNFYKARLFMIKAFIARNMDEKNYKCDQFLPTLKGLQYCLLKRHVLNTRSKPMDIDNEEGFIEYSTEKNISKNTLKDFIDENINNQNLDEKKKFDTYIKQLSTYEEEKKALINEKDAKKENKNTNPRYQTTIIHESPSININKEIKTEVKNESSYNSSIWSSENNLFDNSSNLQSYSENQDNFPDPLLSSNKIFTSSSKTPPPWIAPKLNQNTRISSSNINDYNKINKYTNNRTSSWRKYGESINKS